MSDFVSVINIGDRILHCVVYDRPVWFPAGRIEESIVPSREHFVADALIAFAGDLLGIGPFSWNRVGIDNKELPDDRDAPDALFAARNKIYAAKEPGLLHVALLPIDPLSKADLERLSMPVTFAEVLPDPNRPAWL